MQKTSIKKNFMYQMIYQILIIILPFVTSPYIARVIGAEGLGTYSYSYSIAYYFVLFSMLGLSNYGNRIIAQNRESQDKLNEVFSNVLAIHMLFSFGCFIIYCIYAFFVAKERVYAIIQTAYVLSDIFDISWFYFGIEKFKLTVTRNTIIKILNVICVFTFVKQPSDLWKYCIIMAFGMLISQITLWIPLKKYVKLVKPEMAKMVIHIKPLLILFIPAIAVSLYKYMDKIMIGTLSSKAQLGYYENAEKMINIPLAIIMSFGTVMLPKMSNLVSSNNRAEANRYIGLSMKYVMCLAFALAFGLAGIGKVFAPVFWGKEFYLSGLLIMGLSTTIPFMSFANVIRTQYLIPTERDKEYLSSVIGGAIVNLIINGCLIPRYGAIGATIGTIVAECVVCVIQAWVVRKELPLKKYIVNMIPFLIFGFGMFVVVYGYGRMFDTGLKTLFVQITIGAFLYCGITCIYMYVTNDAFVVSTIQKLKMRKKGKS